MTRQSVGTMEQRNAHDHPSFRVFPAPPPQLGSLDRAARCRVICLRLDGC